VASIGPYSVVHGTSLNIPLAAYFIDSENDPMTMTASYTFNGGPLGIPGGIFTIPSDFNIYVASTGLADVGSYSISVTVSDSQQ
jgi:hypothetical protein